MTVAERVLEHVVQQQDAVAPADVARSLQLPMNRVLAALVLLEQQRQLERSEGRYGRPTVYPPLPRPRRAAAGLQLVPCLGVQIPTCPSF